MYSTPESKQAAQSKVKEKLYSQSRVKANIKQVNTLTEDEDRSTGYIEVSPPCYLVNRNHKNQFRNIRIKPRFQNHTDVKFRVADSSDWFDYRVQYCKNYHVTKIGSHFAGQKEMRLIAFQLLFGILTRCLRTKNS